jgi:hypothetical protein
MRRSEMENNSNEEREQWLKSFKGIYKQTNPSIMKVTKLNSDGQPANPRSLLEAYHDFRPILQSLKNMPKPPEKELRKIKNDFERTLSMCIKAGEMAIKMLDDLNHGARLASRMHVASIVGYVNYAALSHKSLIERLNKIGIFKLFFLNGFINY